MDPRDLTFQESGQGRIKLDIALKRYFSGEALDEELRNRYERYLKSRIRPMMERLIEEENMELLARTAKLGWLQTELIDSFISMAADRGSIGALTFLLQWKEQNSSFEDEEFPL